MTTKEKLTLSVGILVSLIIGLVVLSAISLQILTATEPTSPVADYGLTRALTLLLLFGGLSIAVGVWMLIKLPEYITRPFQELSEGINEIANHNYDTQLNLHGGEAMEQLSSNFNRMASRLRDYHNSSPNCAYQSNISKPSSTPSTNLSYAWTKNSHSFSSTMKP